MRPTMSSLVPIAAACLLTTGFGGIAYSQTQRLNCEGVDAQCLVSEVPVPNVRIVRERDYPKRPAHYLSSNLYTTLAADLETRRRVCAFDFVVAPGGGPLPHTHRNEWETFFVWEGSVTFTVGVNPNPPYNFITQEIPAGTIVYGPIGPVHGFRFQNTSGALARIFSVAMPCGLDQFFHNAGKEVVNYYGPIPPIDFEEITRTAFWAEQRGDGLHIPGTPPPTLPRGTPDHVVSSVFDANRPREIGPFGETRVVLLTPAEVGNISGATAFCGPGAPGREGGTVKYSFFSMPSQPVPQASHVSPYTELFYTLRGTFTFLFRNPSDQSVKTVIVEPRTFIQIEPGVEFAIANLSRGPDGSEPALSLAVSVIPPSFCPPPPFPPPPF